MTRSYSQSDWDAQLSGSKIEPLESATKRHLPRDRSGSIGEDFDIEHSHIEPLDSPVKEHAQPLHEPHGVTKETFKENEETKK
ncbi:hypothetical protein N0V90_004971 [Kalmusia sp. IMI 367209]|nr:hypothetical protein N0V90_004971 [Kalmusia sp. IMI 367209]